jgi:DNA-binding NtrC family response regulator
VSTSTSVLPEPFSAAVFLPGDAFARRLSVQIARIAPHFRIALLTGEPGTGKLTVAHEMHRLSPVARGSFTALDASAFASIDSGELAHRTPGTVYLSGVDRVPLDRQPALLERLDSIARHLRIIVAAESDLRGLVASGRMLQALYERVGALAIRLTPLRERRECIDLIASSLLESLTSVAWFSQLALGRLREHPWPDNFDELWQIVQQVATLTGEITANQLPLRAPEPSAPPALRLEEVIERHVVEVVQRCSGNKLRAAELLGISRSTLYRMLDAATHN